MFLLLIAKIIIYLKNFFKSVHINLFFGIYLTTELKGVDHKFWKKFILQLRKHSNSNTAMRYERKTSQCY